MNLGQWIAESTLKLAEVGIESAKLEAQVLAGEALGKNRSWVIAHLSDEFDSNMADQLLSRRLTQEPLAYILGWREFYGRRFSVNANVLIPRHETETLVETVLDHSRGGSILDFGTGSGCIAITLQLERPAWTVVGLDQSADALEVAAKNAEALGADVKFVRSDGFSEVGDSRFAAIVSNPPYIAFDETLISEVMDWEPEKALFSGPTGLEYYEFLAAESPNFLLPAGQILLEVGYQQSRAVVDILVDHGWLEIAVAKDLSGIERVVWAHR
jgi:release factor glutamine methyltransferase